MHIVTGGAGFIGSAYIRKLNDHGISNIIVVDDLGESDKWKNLVGKSYDEYLHKDDFLELIINDEDIFGKVESVIHLGACSSTTEKDADYLMENNYRYSRIICQWALEQSARFVYASSAATYGDGSNGFIDDHAGFEKLLPLNMYGYSKHLFDLWAKNYKALNDIAGLKFFNVFGPNEYHKEDMSSVVFKAFHQINETGKLKLFKSYKKEYGDGEQKRDFIYIKDAVKLIWYFANNPTKNGIFNIGTGKSKTWNELASATFSAMNLKENIEYIDMPESIRDKYQYFTEADSTKLLKTVGDFQFTSLEDAAADYIQNYLSKENPIW